MASRSWGPVSRVLSPAGVTANRSMAIHLGVDSRRRSSSLPEDGVGGPLPVFRQASFYLALLQVGFGRRRVTTVGRALLPPVFTLACVQRRIVRPSAVSSLCHYPSPHGITPRNAWVLPSTLPMEPGLSSQPAEADCAAIRPPALLAVAKYSDAKTRAQISPDNPLPPRERESGLE